MQKYLEKIKNITQITPDIKKFQGQTIVIKYGGSAMLNENLKKAVMQDIILMKQVGIKPVIVHGGGPEINKLLKQIGKEPEFLHGLRVTDKETMEVVEMVLAGKVNKDIVGHIQSQGINAAGICGKDGNTLLARKKYVNNDDVGFVGEVEQVNINLMQILLENDFIPVIAPIGIDKEGNSYNINADYAAVAVAAALKADQLLFLTDVEGVLEDINDKSSLIPKLSIKDIPEYIEKGIISGGMIPKVECCARGIKDGIKSVHIIDGRIEHSILLEIFAEKSIGTTIEE